MRRLIGALLSYSMADKDDIPTKHLSLKESIAEIKTQILEDDSAKRVTIETENLPAVNVIKIQFQQLLLNILNNAIKYSKPDENAIIKIYCEHIPANKMSEEEAISGKNYLKIIMADNGIGFEQDYSGKIFGLFQRLHTKYEYDGTGIGLAICRKIMQNHPGFITATGKPSEGAIFNLYLPQ
jgi:light-regulated signal transduction histidine kinase (bacteriophytochrome)